MLSARTLCNKWNDSNNKMARRAQCGIGLTTIFLLIYYLVGSYFCHLDLYFKKHLIAMNKILINNNVKFWMNGGGLIGFMRNQALVPWDYDIDLNIMEDEIQSVINLKSQFESLNYEMFTRDDYIPYKENHKITDPCIILYMKPLISFLPIRFHIEFYEWYTLSVLDAKKLGYKLPSDVNGRNVSIELICDIESKDMDAAEKCLRKNKVLPLKEWEYEPYGLKWWMPKDPQYCVVEPFGPNWRIPQIKGWKEPLCYEYWNNSNQMIVFLCLLIWYLFLIYIAINQQYPDWILTSLNCKKLTNNNIKYDKLSIDEDPNDFELDNSKHT